MPLNASINQVLNRRGCHSWGNVCLLYLKHLVPLLILDIIICPFLARLFYKTEEVLSPPARRRRLRLRQRPVKFWGKLLRQKIMSSFISSLAQNLFIFAVLIHMVVLINNQALINIQIYYFFHFSIFLAMFQL